jgi:hypothetical protein
VQPTTALWIITWAAILLLFLAIGAVFREVRMVREQLAQNGYQSELPDIQLDPGLTGGTAGVVIAATPACPLCMQVTYAASELVDAGIGRPTLLTYESLSEWPTTIVERLRTERSVDEWRKVAHLTPPALLKVAADGVVVDIVLPINQVHAEATLREWLAPVEQHQNVS